MYTQLRINIYFFFLFHSIRTTKSFNIDTDAPTIKFGDDDSFFGFSLQGHTSSNSERGVLVGAPLSGDNGDLKWCPSTHNSCRKLIIDVTELARTKGHQGALFGYSISSLDSKNPEPVTICAPRLTRTSLSLHYITGGCFELDADLKNPSVYTSSYVACQNTPDADKQIGLRHCMMGGSVGHHQSRPAYVFMGGPFFYHAAGMGSVLSKDNYVMKQTSVKNLTTNTQLGSSLSTSDRIFDADNDNKRTLYVAYGAPGVSDSAENGNGSILIYKVELNTVDEKMDPAIYIEGREFGSRFGHSVLLLDINGDGWDDLIVGAPYQQLEAEAGTQSAYGAVSIFLNTQPRSHRDEPFSYDDPDTYQLLFPSNKHHDCGRYALSAYGATLVELGDINHDGFKDFAVGAPYGPGGGLVFIYHGSKTGKIGLPTQVICRTNLTNEHVMGLGFSIGLKGLDIDGNGYADVAIGAPLSDSVLVLRTRPILKYRAHLTLDDGGTDLSNYWSKLIDCTTDASTLVGYKYEKVYCLDVKLLFTYTSVDDKPCEPGKEYTIKALLKPEPHPAWLKELYEEKDQIDAAHVDKASANSPCDTAPSDDSINVQKLFQKFAIAPFNFMGEKSLVQFRDEAKTYFSINQSAADTALESPGGYLPVEMEAICRRISLENIDDLPSSTEMRRGKTIRLVFRDIRLVDQTKPMSIGIRWLVNLPKPFPSAKNINDFPIADPRDNSQRVQLTFKNRCSHGSCCTRLRVAYFYNVSRDAQGPVVFVGDDKTQTINVRASVTNIGNDPAYMVNLLSSFPPLLLEVDPSYGSGINVAEDAATCHLDDPLIPGMTAECEIRWLVDGRQLTLQTAQFSVNSTIISGAGSKVTIEGPASLELKVNIKMIVNVSVTGLIEPDTAYFSGNVTDGISSITAENQIGATRLRIKFTVRNLRSHSLIPASRLIVDWPYEITGDTTEPHGKYLLYLLEKPSVVQRPLLIPVETTGNTSSVTCDSRALEILLNPHDFRIFPQLQPSKDGIPVNVAPVDIPESHPKGYPPLVSTMPIEEVPPRYRLNDSKREERRMTTVGCYNGQLRCIPIVCDLGKLSYKAGPIAIEFKARLWDNTLRDDFKSFFLTGLDLTATWRADVKYAINLGDSDHAQDTLHLRIFNNLEQKPIKPKYMALYISLAVFGGLILLAVIIIILYKVGFFKRRRFLRKHRKQQGGEDTKQSQPAQDPARKPLMQPTQAIIPRHSHELESRGTIGTDHARHSEPSQWRSSRKEHDQFGRSVSQQAERSNVHRRN